MKTRNLFSLIAALCILVATASPAFASESGHTCTYQTWLSYEYTSYSSVLHKVSTIKHYDCTSQSCPIAFSEVVSESLESHNYVEVWAGQDYHSGSYHYAYYVHKCTSCRYIDSSSGVWKSWACPGGDGGSCILPQSLLAFCEIM